MFLVDFQKKGKPERVGKKRGRFCSLEFYLEHLCLQGLVKIVQEYSLHTTPDLIFH